MNFKLHRGSAPLLVSIPHLGTAIPEELRAHYTPRAMARQPASDTFPGVRIIAPSRRAHAAD